MGASSAWKDDKLAAKQSPYVSWWIAANGPFDEALLGPLMRGGISIKTVDWEKAFLPSPNKGGPRSSGQTAISLPSYALSNGSGSRKPPKEKIPNLPPPDSVIIGIIDSGIALGHARFRHANGTTRFLSAWQQSAKWNGQTDLPFGEEIFQHEIDTLIKQNTANGVLDEAAFNRASRISNMTNAIGQRDVEFDASHGTHVLDLATGYPLKSDTTRLPIIAVNLPARASMGAAGSFLEFFVISAISRIIKTADQLWDTHYSDDNAKGFPIVINLSYGLQAGPKDGTSPIGKYISDLIMERKTNGRPPLRVVLPAGNDNLSRGNIRRHLGRTSKPLLVNWRVMPEDQTSNYVDIWSDVLPHKDFDLKNSETPLKLKITAPDGYMISSTAGKTNQYLDIANYGRIYCRVHNSGENFRINYVICTAPTLTQSPDLKTAPSGLWKIELAYEKGVQKDKDVYLRIQSDQTVGAGGAAGKLSYFDHPKYQKYDENGRIQDTDAFPYENLGISHQDRNDYFGPVQRKGTLNAVAAFEEAIVLTGHRSTDGRPAPYASTGRGDHNIGGKKSPTASFPTDDGYAHFGILAAGNNSASTAALQGTSFANAQATRIISQALLGWYAAKADPKSTLGSAMWFQELAKKNNNKSGNYLGSHNLFKSGFGRLESPVDYTVPRRGWN
ncbi:MAG: S8 family serine peptidase [Rhodobacteraceae bacterium]|nr:S8 family serine peptidase [Paracoccaceae bacterium]